MHLSIITSAVLLGAASATKLASVLLCNDAGGKCGYYFEYNGAGGLQEIRYSAFGPGCLGAAAFSHTNSARFWEKVATAPSTECGGVAMGYNPTGKKICLEETGYKNSGADYLNWRCSNEFDGDWDVKGSSVEVFENVGDILV